MINISRRMVKLCTSYTYYYANYTVYTDNTSLKDQAAAVANTYTVVTVKKLDGSNWPTEAAASAPLMASAPAPLMTAAPAPAQAQASALDDAIEMTTIGGFCGVLDDFLMRTEKKTYIAVSPSTEVTYGFDADCNTEYCDEHGIPYYDIRRADGCVVHAPGSVTAADIRPSTYGWIVRDFAYAFTEFLHSKGIDAACTGNDITIGDQKVVSTTAMQLFDSGKPMIYSGFQISINQDYDAIRHICLATPNWSPCALSTYGITTEEVVAWLTDWFASLEPTA